MSGPLTGIKVIELGGIGPGPFCGMLLADLGAEVIRVDRIEEAGRTTVHPYLHRGRRSITVDFKDPAGVDAVLRLIEQADVVFEGFRPGVTERLGLGPEECLARNPRVVYGRMTGWGQDGPYAQEPGHDINYIGLGGALGAIGPAGGDPVVPLNLVGDFGGGSMFLALGITSALLQVKVTGRGQVVDAAITDGTAVLMAMSYGLLAGGRWIDRRGANMPDGGVAPYYRTYRCADGGHLAVGCIEPQFWAAMLRVLALEDDPFFTDQHDTGRWPAMIEWFAEIFAGRTRDEWTAVFDGQGACVTPVLSLTEAAAHPHNAARATFIPDLLGDPQPAPAPRFSGTPTGTPRPAPVVGAHTREVLTEAGLDADLLLDKGVVA